MPLSDTRKSLGCCSFQKTLYNWGATFFTYLKPPLDATYNVSVASDNGALLWIDGTLVVDNSGALQQLCALPDLMVLQL